MCIAIPMTVTAVDGIWADIERPGKAFRADASLAGEVRPGDRVLVFKTEVLRVIDEEEARRIEAALACVDAAMSGQPPDVDGAFADILENTGRLPPHLKAARRQAAL